MILYVNFLVYEHWFMRITISELKDHSISMHQAGYTTFVVAKYLNTVTTKENSEFHNTNLPHDMIFTE